MFMLVMSIVHLPTASSYTSRMYFNQKLSMQDFYVIVMLDDVESPLEPVCLGGFSSKMPATMSTATIKASGKRKLTECIDLMPVSVSHKRLRPSPVATLSTYDANGAIESTMSPSDDRKCSDFESRATC